MMPRAIIIDAGFRFISELLPDKEVPPNLAGLRTRLSRDIDLLPFAVVPEGSCGTVVSVDLDSGAVEVELDDIIPGLRLWFNTVTLVPFDTDDILDAFQVILGVAADVVGLELAA